MTTFDKPRRARFLWPGGVEQVFDGVVGLHITPDDTIIDTVEDGRYGVPPDWYALEWDDAVGLHDAGKVDARPPAGGGAG